MNQAARKRLAAMALFLLICLPFSLAQAQTVKVTGKVTDNLNEPMIGVSIVEKGTTNGCITDIDGNYTLNVNQGATIIFSYIGYVTQEKQAVAGVMNIVLKEDSETLDEVVVVGYGVQKKSSVTGAISQVKAEDMQNRTISDASQALQGKTAGVQLITTSAAPGSSPTVRVRGYSSNAASSPLYVVDGVRMSSIAGIDPNDIASMEVLKDAASAAIYGAEAGNGVILISTKKGKAGQGKITYDFQLSTQSIARMPKLLNAEEYVDYMSESSAFDPNFIKANWDGKTSTDWLDIAFENSLMMKHNLAFAGGGEQGNYYLSLTYLDNDGIVKGKDDVYQRMTATINAEYNIKPWLKVGTTNQIEKYNTRGVSTQNAYGSFLQSVLMMDPLTPDTYAPDKLPAHMQNALNQGSTLLQDENGNYYASSLFYEGENYHPTVMRKSTIGRNSGFNVNGSIYADFTPIKGFTFTSRFGYRLGGTRSANTSLPFYGNSTQRRDYVSINSQSATSIYYQWENFANYVKSFNGHTINAMLGMSFQESSYDYVKGSLDPDGEHAVLQNNPLFFYLNYAASSAVKGLNGEKTRSAKMSYFGRASYDYMGRYMAHSPCVPMQPICRNCLLRTVGVTSPQSLWDGRFQKKSSLSL